MTCRPRSTTLTNPNWLRSAVILLWSRTAKLCKPTACRVRVTVNKTSDLLMSPMCGREGIDGYLDVAEMLEQFLEHVQDQRPVGAVRAG